MSLPDLLAAQKYALARLYNELDPHLVYHNYHHTHGIVLPATRELAQYMSLSNEEHVLLLTAAAFHDLGFVESRQDHEENGINIAAEALPEFDYTPKQIETIGQIIRATKIPQNPTDALGALLADADLSVLAHPDFLSYNLALRQELAYFGQKMSDFEWFNSQHKFVSSHRYFSTTAREQYEKGKAGAIALLAEKRDAAR